MSEREVEQCFENRDGSFLKDSREAHLTDPPTLWFIAETNKGRLLKVCFVNQENKIFIKTSYEPNSAEIEIYNRKAK